MPQVSGLLYSMWQSVFWPHHFLMIGRKTAVYFVAVALIETWKAENTFSIQTKPHPTAIASFPWGHVNTVFLLFLLAENSQEQNADFFVLKIFIVAFKMIHWILWRFHFGAFVPCGLLDSCYVFRVWGGANNLLLTLTCTVTHEENTVVLFHEGKQQLAVVLCISPLSFTVSLPLTCI